MMHLPPKEGYIEVLDETGAPVYKETRKKKQEQKELLSASAKLQVFQERQEFLEDCIAEMAAQVYN